MIRRVLLDTNVYEFILKKLEKDLLEILIGDKIFVIYGNELIRKELRAIPKERFDGVGKKIIKLRSALLSLYDMIVGRHNYQISSDMKKLAERYFTVYNTLGGNIAREKILNDFIIVSCATVKQLDIVVSEDNKTMFSKLSLKTYEIVNKLEKRRTPKFIGFSEFVKEIRRCASL